MKFDITALIQTPDGNTGHAIGTVEDAPGPLSAAFSAGLDSDKLPEGAMILGIMVVGADGQFYREVTT